MFAELLKENVWGAVILIAGLIVTLIVMIVGEIRYCIEHKKLMTEKDDWERIIPRGGL